MNNERMPIRFEDILQTARGKDDAFEELVCQLARRHPSEVAAEFRRIHGPGGDGGVEAYWLLADHGEVGYQAKYYLASRNVRWNAIDESVRTALGLHPRLTKYVVALACDLTDMTARGGKSGWEKWTERKAGWEADARRVLGHDVTFELWPASQLREMLEQPLMTGLRAHWFGTLPLTAEWLAGRARRAVADLGDRYHAEDHVSVGSERLFDVVLRCDAFRQRLRGRLQRARTSAGLHLVGIGHRGEDAENARRAVDAVLEVDSQIAAASWTPWAAAQWSGLAKIAQGSVSVLATNLRDDWRVQEGPARQYSKALRTQLDGLARLADDLEALDHVWTGLASQAEHQRVVLLTGRGGSGKSHLLAHQAEAAAAEGRPVILVLGQQLGVRAIWPQILERLGVEGTAERFLQALDSSAEAMNKRALFIVDALNEGAGATLWRNEIASFIAMLKPYLNIVCVLSCRSEYLRYVVPTAVGSDIVQVEVQGFVTAEEQRAAALVYMDRKGIARPGTPWLAEEFTNPLFLRSVCVALAREGRREFPQGLVGTKRILAFYVSSVARHLVASYEGTDDLAAPTFATLLAVAKAMATSRRDYLRRRAADLIAQKEFASFFNPGNETWLEVLHRSGLLRFDPDPEIDPDSEVPLPKSIDVVRFSFQRFQDQLMAEALLQGISDVGEAFAPSGSLYFLTTPERWDVWGPGVAAALAIQIPEKFHKELVDAMPGGLEQWNTSGEMASIFSESIRLRAPEAFSARTTELFETWVADGAQSVSLLFEVATTACHPWNAEAMHDRLIALSMPERDVRWTFALSGMGRRSRSHRFFSLCDWCASPEAMTTTDRTRELAALALAWCLTSSNRLVRDEATKALTHLMLAQAGVMPYLIDRLKDVDDNYLSERLWAAAFGACTHNRGAQRLGSYAGLAWRVVFSGTAAPRNILLRDYSRAIVDLAVHDGVDFEGMDLARCRPPYSDEAIALDEVAELDRESAEGLSDGAQRIVSSCSEFGDFGSYCIKPAVNDITTVRLVELPVASKEGAFRNFWSTVLDGREDRITAFRELEKHLRLMRMPQLADRDDGLVFEKRKPSAAEIEEAKQLEARLLSMLIADEVEIFERDGAPWLADSFSPPTERVDAGKCRAWVARRAIEVGGAAVDADNRLASRQERPIVERLGKKYQWLALSELLCHLTSKLGLEVGYQEDRTIQPYDMPPDVGLIRDVDPTVLAYESAPAAQPEDGWMFEPQIVLDEVPEADLSAWPVLADAGTGFEKRVVRTASDGQKWFPLYDHAHVTNQYADRSTEHGMRQQEFRRIFTVFVEKARLQEFVAAIEADADLSVTDWEVRQLTDGPYLGEAVWRATWPQEQWGERGIPGPRSVPQAFPLCEYRWESHLDLALQEGASAYVPAAWLTRMLGLKFSPGGQAALLDSTGQGVFLQKSSQQGNVVLLREDALTCLSAESGLSCVWLLVAERNAWPGGTNAMATWRRSEGVAWIEDGRVVARTWKRDGSAAEVAQASRTAPRKRGAK